MCSKNVNNIKVKDREENIMKERERQRYMNKIDFICIHIYVNIIKL